MCMCSDNIAWLVQICLPAFYAYEHHVEKKISRRLCIQSDANEHDELWGIHGGATFAE